jgi:hypothetical protein
MRQGANSLLMVADRPYGEFYDFCSVSPEYFVFILACVAVFTVHFV